MTGRVSRSCALRVDADVAWDLVLRPALFRWVAAPVLRATGPLPDRWAQGQRHVLHLWLLGVIPTGRHDLDIEALDLAGRVLQTDERSRLLRSWRHRITVESVGPGRCRYGDEIELDAGPLTAVVTAGARLFFAWRQRRLKLLVAVLGSTDAA